MASSVIPDAMSIARYINNSLQMFDFLFYLAYNVIIVVALLVVSRGIYLMYLKFVLLTVVSCSRLCI